MSVTRSALIYGKLPGHGDFVAHGWTAAERDALDAWLSASLAAARTASGADFEDRFDHAPPWRCAAPAGAVAPSQDAAGRRYPLYVALRGRTGEALAAACEELLYAAIGGGWDVDRLAIALGEIVGSDEVVVVPRWWTEGGEAFPPAALEGERPPSLLAAMLERESAA